MTEKICVTILDDHQNIIDGYVFRLSANPRIEIAATINFGEELEPTLAEHPTDVLLLDVNVPVSTENFNPYPILYAIPKLLQTYPRLSILVISMYAERGLIRAVMEAGASGYILKDDQTAARDLGGVVVGVANGEIYFSNKALQLYKLSIKGNDNIKNLTTRQMEILSILGSRPDFTTAQLADKLHVSNSTVRNLLSAAYVRLGVNTRAAAIAKASQLGIILAPTFVGSQKFSLVESILNYTTVKIFFLNLFNLFRRNLLWSVLFVLIIAFYVLLKNLQP